MRRRGVAGVVGKWGLGGINPPLPQSFQTESRHWDYKQPPAQSCGEMRSWLGVRWWRKQVQASRTEDSCSTGPELERMWPAGGWRKRRTSITLGDCGGLKVGGLDGSRLNQSSALLLFELNQQLAESASRAGLGTEELRNRGTEEPRNKSLERSVKGPQHSWLLWSGWNSFDCVEVGGEGPADQRSGREGRSGFRAEDQGYCCCCSIFPRLGHFKVHSNSLQDLLRSVALPLHGVFLLIFGWNLNFCFMFMTQLFCQQH